MGFCLENENPKHVSPEKFKEITGWVSGVEFAAEFGTYSEDSILEMARNYPGLGYLELSEESQLESFLGKGYKLIWKVGVRSQSHIDQLLAKADFLDENQILLHLVSEDLSLSDDIIHSVRELSQLCEVILGFGITGSNVLNLLEKTGARGISLEGGEEIKPGLKDFDELSEILEILEVEE